MSLRIAPMMLHSIDRDGRITEVSDLWLAKLGYTWDEVIGRRSIEFLTDESAAYARDVVLPAFFVTGSCEVEYDMRRKDGTILPVRLHGVAVRDESGEFMRSIAVVEDLSERRALERKMFEVQKLESLGVMAGNIAHDFNNLLTSVTGSAQIAARHAAHLPAAASALDNVLLAAARAGELCKQLLAYSGRGRFEVVTTDLDRIVAEMAPVLEVPVVERARLVLELANAGMNVDVDLTQIRQVLMNLVINAAEAMGDRRGTIAIRTARAQLDRHAVAASLRPEVGPGTFASLSVTDDGRGMAAEVRDRVFEPFFSTKGSGRGLGLAAILGIVRGHRGTMTLTSEPGHGSCFTIYFPLARAVAREPGARTPAAASPRGLVLVVDDDELLLATIAQQLTDAGIASVVATSAREALALLERSPIELAACVIDVSMPEMTGPQLAQRIASIAPAAQLVLMSGFDRVDVPALPHIRFLRKPFTEAELLAAIAPR